VILFFAAGLDEAIPLDAIWGIRFLAQVVLGGLESCDVGGGAKSRLNATTALSWGILLLANWR
jgi:hypothetical protein